MLSGNDIADKLCANFEKDGFVVMRNCIDTESFINAGMLPFDDSTESSGANANLDVLFSNLFKQLYDHGHTKFPTHCRRRSIAPPAKEQREQKPILERNDDRNDELNLEYALGLGVKNGFSEVIMRSPGRYEISLLSETNNENDVKDLKSKLVNILKAALPFAPRLLQGTSKSRDYQGSNSLSWDDVKIINVALVVSTPGSTCQQWHADGAHMSLHEHLPCHCFNIFIPLQRAVTADLGPTEFRPGTQYHTRDLTKLMLLAKARKTLRPPVAPTLEVGDCLMFDYRILHRGLANVSDNMNRPILVVAIAQPWFRDIVNTSSKSMYD